MSLKNKLQDVIKSSILKLDSTYIEEFNKLKLLIKKIDDKYITNIAILLGERLQNNPITIANMIKNKIKDEFLEEIIITNNGELVFQIKLNYILSYISKIKEENYKYGICNIGNNKKINIEVNAINSNSENNLKKLIYADNLERILNVCNYDVDSDIYYLNNCYASNFTYDDYRINIKNMYEDDYLNNIPLIEEIIDKLKQENLCYIKDDTLAIKTSLYGDRKDRIIIQKDGTYTKYLLNIVHNFDKIQKGYKTIIYITNEVDFLEGIDIILNIFKYPNIITIIEVKDIQNNQLLELSDLNNKRYQLLMDNGIWDEYNNIEKKYITICNKVKEIKEKNDYKFNDFEYNILNKIIEYEDTIFDSNQEKNPQLLVKYLKEFLEILYSCIENINSYDLYVCIKITIENALNLIGIIPKEEI